MKAEEEEERDTDSTVQHKADPRPPISRAFISIPGRQAYLDRPAQEPKAHGNLMFASPGKKLSLLNRLRSR